MLNLNLMRGTLPNNKLSFISSPLHPSILFLSSSLSFSPPLSLSLLLSPLLLLLSSPSSLFSVTSHHLHLLHHPVFSPVNHLLLIKFNPRLCRSLSFFLTSPPAVFLPPPGPVRPADSSFLHVDSFSLVRSSSTSSTL